MKALRRLLRILVRLIGVAVVLAVLVLIFIHTSWGKSFVRGRIEAKLGEAVDGKVALGKLDYTFLFGEVTLGDLDITDASGRRAIHIGTLVADVDRGSVLDGSPLVTELRVDGVAADIVQNADGTTNLTHLVKPAEGKPLARVRIAKLSIAGAATLTKPDGTTISIDDLAIAGSVDARPAAQEADIVLDRVAAHLAIAAPGAPVRTAELVIGHVEVARRGDRIDADAHDLAAGPLAIAELVAHSGEHDVRVIGGRVGHDKLAAFLGHPVLIDDVAFDASLAGPLDKLALHGEVKTRSTSLVLAGTVDASKPGVPSYDVELTGRGKSADLVADAPPVETDLHVAITGTGIVPETLDADAVLEVGPTKIKDIHLDGLHAHAIASHGALRLAELTAKGLGFEIGATGELQPSHDITARVTVGGNPAEAIRVLGAAGIAIPRRVPVLERIDVAVSATGNVDREVAVTIEPARIGIAGGEIAFAGNAKLDVTPAARAAGTSLVSAATTIDLRALDLASLAALAGKPPAARGTLSGHLDLTRSPAGQHASYQLALALVEPNLAVRVGGDATTDAATITATVSRGALSLAAAKVRVALDAQGVRLDGPWHVTIDAPSHAISDLIALAPPEIRAKLPPDLPDGAIAVHADLAGTPKAPSGTIDVTASADALPALGTQKLAVHTTLTPGPTGLVAVAATTIALDTKEPIAVDARVELPPLRFVGTRLDVDALRTGARFYADLVVPERAIATLAPLRDKLAGVDGTVGGHLAATGGTGGVQLGGELHWQGYKLADGSAGQTTLALTGKPDDLAVIVHHGALAIVAGITRHGDRVDVQVAAHADPTPPLALVPAFAFTPDRLAGLTYETGALKVDLGGSIALEHGAVVEHHAHGGLDLTGASFAIPHTDRKWHDIGLSLTAADDHVHLASLALHESDIQDGDRNVVITGDLARDRASLSIAAHDWLVSGGSLFGEHDAPRAAVDADIAIAADLTAQIPAIDATVRTLELRSPDRQERAHQPEQISVGGDVIYLDGKTPAGKLPAIPVPEVESPRPRPHVDVRVHIPRSIHVVQTPFDLYAHGELTVTVRDEGIATRGTLAMDRGELYLFGRYHDLVDGKVSFTDLHPHGWMELAFERRVPDISMRDLARTSGNGRITFEGAPAKPKVTLGGASGAGLLETMSMLNAGRPVNITAPDLPASETVQVPRGDQLFVLTFMASNLPHLLFLDRIAAWADPYEPTGGYGQIHDVDAEKSLRGGDVRVRAVLRPPTPGRSEGELQLDRVLVHDDRTSMGVGLRAGDRIGGGLGLFLEWSSQ